MELPAYREKRSWPARHMQTEGHAAVLSSRAGVWRLVWMGDVTRGAWLKIGDAPRSQAVSRLPKRACLRLAVSATVYFQRKKGRLKLSITGVSPARMVLAIGECFDTETKTKTEARVCRLGPWQREDGALPRTIRQYK